MAEGEIEEGLFDLFKEEGEGAEGKTETELLEEAKEKTSDAIDKGFDALGIDLDNAPPGGEQAEVEEGLKEGKEATKDLSKVDPAETVDKWAKPKAVCHLLTHYARRRDDHVILTLFSVWQMGSH